MEKLIGSVVWLRVDERPIASHLLPVLARIGHWLYPVHFAFLPGFWSEPEDDQHRAC